LITVVFELRIDSIVLVLHVIRDLIVWLVEEGFEHDEIIERRSLWTFRSFLVDKILPDLLGILSSKIVAFEVGVKSVQQLVVLLKLFVVSLIVFNELVKFPKSDKFLIR